MDVSKEVYEFLAKVVILVGRSDIFVVEELAQFQAYT